MGVFFIISLYINYVNESNNPTFTMFITFYYVTIITVT